MASFNREEYETVFAFAVQVFNETRITTPLNREAIHIMDMCENVIGQKLRPDRKQGDQP